MAGSLPAICLLRAGGESFGAVPASVAPRRPHAPLLFFPN